MNLDIIYLVLMIEVTFLNSRIEALSEIPNCAFEDTVNLTSSQKFSNGSYLYEGVLVPPELTGHYDFIELYEGERQHVQEHIRGCVCHLKQCVKFCCHPKAQMFRDPDTLEQYCDNELNEKLFYSPYVSITLGNGSHVVKHVLNEFVFQTGIPCDNGEMLMPHEYDEEKWELFENGTLLILGYQTFVSRRDYCLQAYIVDDIYVLNPMNCLVNQEEPPTIMINSIVMAISLPFLYATILIYWCIPQLWNLHTKCLLCYLISLAIGVTMLVMVNIGTSDYEHIACAAIGFVTYYFLVAVFFWLNVICFDLWHNFRGTISKVHNLSQRKRFLLYSLYAWGIPGLMTASTIVLQYSNISMALKPGIGHKTCYLKVDDWSAMIYFHGPCLLLIIVNTILFCLTTIRIFNIRKELRRFSQGEGSRRHLRSQQNNIWLFLRMFIVMGIVWLLEIIGYMIGNRSAFVFLIADMFNSSMGLIMFMMLVMKKKVLMLLKKRILCIEGSDTTDSTESQYSDEEVTLQNMSNGFSLILK